jgi:hypothetical protein
MEVTPALVLATWAAGIAAGGAVVAYWGIVGPGFTWLTAATLVLVGAVAAFAGGSVVGAAATLVALGAAAAGHRNRIAAVLFAVAAVGFLPVAAGDGPVLAALTGTVLLGGMTVEMLLGHWFLVDPRLPRQALQRLDLAAALGLVADVAAMVGYGVWRGGDGLLLAAWVSLAVMTALLVAAVWFSLRERGYSGVMAATGLSYLGVLTTFGVVVIGRLLIGGR